MLHFCTYFDRNYLSRGLALYASLALRCDGFTLWVLCLDDATRAVLEHLALPNMRCRALVSLESADAELAGVKNSRPIFEYYYTCGPAFMCHLLRTEPAIELITYLDADLFFFEDPAPAAAELAQASIGLVSHRNGNTRARLQSGEFNAGWVSFRRDSEGSSALEWWRARCIDSCSIDDESSAVCGDQKYLQDLPSLFERVHVLKHPGANLGFWNYARFRYTRVGDQVLVEGAPLLWFHFGDFRIAAGLWLSPSYATRAFFPSRLIRRRVLAPYARVLLQIDRGLGPGSQIAHLTGIAIVREDLYAAWRKSMSGRLRFRFLYALRRVANHVFLPFRRGGPLEPEVRIILDAAAKRGRRSMQAAPAVELRQHPRY